MKKIRILSIDGGGIRGIIPGVILTALEQILQERDPEKGLKIGEYFDLIAGTSTGGILSCLYMMPDSTGKAKYSAQDALDLYLDNGNAIFKRSFWKKLSSLWGVVHEKYSVNALFGELSSYFGEIRLSQLIRPSLITSYDITERRAVFFTSQDAKTAKQYDFFVRDVARATSAAPTYFQPAHIKSLDTKFWPLIDGGVFANNPSLCAYAEARKTKFSTCFPGKDKKDLPTAKDMVIVSLGTGSVKKMYHFKDFRNAGEVKWLEPIIDILMSGNAETVDYQLTQMYGTLEFEQDREDYFRLEPGLLEAQSEMDLASPENILNLKNAGLAFADDNRGLLLKIADRLIEHK